jgi:hypothetical protein
LYCHIMNLVLLKWNSSLYPTSVYRPFGNCLSSNLHISYDAVILSLLFIFFFLRQPHHAAQAGLKFKILHCHLPKCRDYWHASLCLALGFNSWVRTSEYLYFLPTPLIPLSSEHLTWNDCEKAPGCCFASLNTACCFPFSPPTSVNPVV